MIWYGYLYVAMGLFSFATVVIVCSSCRVPQPSLAKLIGEDEGPLQPLVDPPEGIKVTGIVRQRKGGGRGHEEV